MVSNARVQISDETYTKAMQSPTVRAALLAKAREKQAVAEQIASNEGVELNTELSQGTRPKGRPYARVSSPNVAQEYGTSIVERKRILGRAAES